MSNKVYHVTGWTVTCQPIAAWRECWAGGVILFNPRLNLVSVALR